LKLKLAYKLKNGTIFITESFESDRYNRPQDVDFLEDVIKKKVNDATLEFDPENYRYSELESIEIIFED